MGADFPSFMEHGINISDRVLIIGTPKYKERSEDVKGGVSFEHSIIKSTYYNQGINITKFVPCLRKGTFKESFPELLSTRKGFDFSNDNKYSEEFEELVKPCSVIQEAPDLL